MKNQIWVAYFLFPNWLHSWNLHLKNAAKMMQDVQDQTSSSNTHCLLSALADHDSTTAVFQLHSEF